MNQNNRVYICTCTCKDERDQGLDCAYAVLVSSHTYTACRMTFERENSYRPGYPGLDLWTGSATIYPRNVHITNLFKKKVIRNEA